MQARRDEEIRRIEKQICSMERALRWFFETDQRIPAALEIKITRTRERCRALRGDAPGEDTKCNESRDLDGLPDSLAEAIDQA